MLEGCSTYGSECLKGKSRPNSCPFSLMLNSIDLDCPVGFWPIFSIKVSLKQRRLMFYHHILDAEWLFGGVQQSQVEFHTSGSCSQTAFPYMEL